MVETVAGYSGKKDKIALLEEFLEDEDFRRIINYTYNPFNTYGIANIPDRATSGSGEFNDNTYDILDELISRCLTGNKARDTIQEEIRRLDSASASLFIRIIMKDLRAGFSDKSINKAYPGLIVTFPYMRCSLMKDVKMDEFFKTPVYAQIKADGMYAAVTLKDFKVHINSRKGKPLLGFLDIEQFVKDNMIPNAQYHGELRVTRDGILLSRKEGNGLLNKVIQGGTLTADERPFFTVWDFEGLVTITGKRSSTMLYEQRLNMLETMIEYELPISEHVKLVKTKIVYNMAAAERYFNEVVDKGEEGLILKSKVGLWKDGTSKHQVKMKEVYEADLEVIGFEEGTGRNEGRLGKLICTTGDDLLEVGVGTGFSDGLRDSLWSSKYTVKGRIVAVKYNRIITSSSNDRASLFLPVFVEFRSDKSIADNLDRLEGAE